MCTQRIERPRVAPRIDLSLTILLVLAWLQLGSATPTVQAQAVIQRIQAATERVEMTANTSRILTLDYKIPRAQVNNPELLVLTPLSPNQIQVSAKKPGVTQVNLWDEKGQVFSVDVIIYGDVKELEMALKMQFPSSAVRVYRYSSSLVLTGFVDRPDDVSRMMRLAEDYSPKVINNISVGGVQQILLHVRVMEVSRTKLRTLGFDFASFSGGGSLISSVSGLITNVEGATVTTSGGETIDFSLVNNGDSFLGVLEALRQYDLLKILAEPTLVTVSGRPASFTVGGEFPILVPQSLGTVSIEYKKFGTQIDFVPIVLGNGNIRLEVRPRVSEIDNTRSVVINDVTVPGLRVREVDTGVEMKAGQTLALAGLIQNRLEAQNRGVPWLADLPWVGVGFRRVQESLNEIELLMMVRPEFADALDPHEVPPGGPGLDTTSPNDHELYLRGYIEVPRCCSNGNCANCRNGQPGAAAVDPANPTQAPATGDGPVSTSRGSHQAQDGSDASSHPYNPSLSDDPEYQDAASDDESSSGVLGPVGYDVEK